MAATAAGLTAIKIGPGARKFNRGTATGDPAGGAVLYEAFIGARYIGIVINLVFV
jgi:hypothetical protein